MADVTRREIISTIAAGVLAARCRSTSPSTEAIAVLDWSVGALARAIRTGQFTSESLVAACLQRIARVNPTLNAVVRVRGEEALEEAHRADQIIQRGGQLAPLHGVPMT